MIVNVIEATYVENFIIALSLKVTENSSSKIIKKNVDLFQYIKNKKENGIFAPLKNIAYFKDFKLNANTIEWKNGVDIAPERFLEL
ncbi:MAG: DUF2442 domain-containing protein [Campylobacterota bacterium]|nr:DUF2442 domain-containing protein [Campylobacterota bacterium]